MSLEHVDFSEGKCLLSSLSSPLEMQSLFMALEIYIYHFIVKTKRIYCSCMIGLIIESDKDELINLKKNCDNLFSQPNKTWFPQSMTIHHMCLSKKDK